MWDGSGLTESVTLEEKPEEGEAKSPVNICA